jgi:hypothetical protein
MATAVLSRLRNHFFSRSSKSVPPSDLLLRRQKSLEDFSKIENGFIKDVSPELITVGNRITPEQQNGRKISGNKPYRKRSSTTGNLITALNDLDKICTIGTFLFIFYLFSDVNTHTLRADMQFNTVV